MSCDSKIRLMDGELDHTVTVWPCTPGVKLMVREEATADIDLPRPAVRRL